MTTNLSPGFKLVDISIPLSQDYKMHTPVGVEDLQLTIEVLKDYDAPGGAGQLVRGLQARLHHGTHVDAPEHFVRGGPQVRDIPLTTFVGPAVVADVRDALADDKGISSEAIRRAIEADYLPGDRLLIRTDWNAHYGEPDYLEDSPYLTAEAIHWCVEQGFPVVGLDFAHTKDDPKAPHRYYVTRYFCENGVVTMGYVDNLGGIESPRVFLMALPLALEGIEASPVRAVVLDGVELLAMRVLVTGGTGFIGSYVVRELVRRGDHVVVIDAGDPDLLLELVSTLDAPLPVVLAIDVVDVSALARVIKEHEIDAIVHLAGLLGSGCRLAPRQGALVNVVGTAGVFELAHLFGIRRLVWAASISVFGYLESDRVVPDDAPHVINGFYGLYKSTNEHQARLYFEEFGVPSTGLRVAFSYGYGRTRGSGSWVRDLMAKPAVGEPARIAGGDVAVPWQHVEDTSTAIIAALDAEPDGARVYNTRGEPRTKQEAIDYVRVLLPGADIVLEPEKSGGYATGLDDSAFRSDFGWEPAISMEAGILRTVNGYRHAVGLPPVTPP